MTMGKGSHLDKSNRGGR